MVYRVGCPYQGFRKAERLGRWKGEKLGGYKQNQKDFWGGISKIEKKQRTPLNSKPTATQIKKRTGGKIRRAAHDHKEKNKNHPLCQ